MYIPTSLDSSAQRRLSVDLGGGACEWQPPEYVIPNNIDFYKTLVAGFPSCDKRMTFIQMEALTGWAAVDEWDLYQEGYSNHPFIKSNYPHHEGIWSWGSQVDQVVMVVRNIRRTMVEYHDILWDIATAKNSAVSDAEVLYKHAPPISSFFMWRDSRVMDEIAWYGWFIGASISTVHVLYPPPHYLQRSIVARSFTGSLSAVSLSANTSTHHVILRSSFQTIGWKVDFNVTSTSTNSPPHMIGHWHLLRHQHNFQLLFQHHLLKYHLFHGTLRVLITVFGTQAQSKLTPVTTLLNIL